MTIPAPELFKWIPLTGFGIDAPGDFCLSVRIFQETGIGDFWDYQILDADFKLIWTGFSNSLEAAKRDSLVTCEGLETLLAFQQKLKLVPEEQINDETNK